MPPRPLGLGRDHAPAGDLDRRALLKLGVLSSTAGFLGAGSAVAQAVKQPTSSSYAATATARPWTRPQRPGPPISIDVHTHWAPAAYLKAKADLGQPDFLDPINYDLARRIAWMNSHGVQTQVLTLGGYRPWGGVTSEQGARVAAVANDAAGQAHSEHPERFLAGIELDCSDPARALVELNRVAGRPGMVCAHLPTSLAGRDYLFEPAFAPVLARCEALRLPILLHPLDGEPNWFAGHRLADASSGVNPDAAGPSRRFPGLTNSLGNSLEMAVCIAKLIVSGTLDRYPELTFIAVGGGGAIPYVAGRLEYRSGGRLPRPLPHYLRRFYYDALVYWPVSLRYLTDVVGTDRVVLGTDNMFGPGDQMMEQPDSIIDQVGYAEADRDLILRGNLKRLFRI